ncbi:MAG: hypothetical protein AAFP23_04200, partial [Pseudomonadota bacterium]
MMKNMSEISSMDAKAHLLDRATIVLVRGAFARPWPVLIVILALMLASIGAATFLRIDTDSSRMLNRSLPFQERAQAINAAFAADHDKNGVLDR